MSEIPAPCVILTRPQLAENIGAAARVMANFGLAVNQALTATQEGQKVGLLVGAERTGLETDELALAHAIVTIPIDPKFKSLNLAQAVALLAYEWRMSVADALPPAFEARELPADRGAMLGLYEHLEKDLDTSGFFHPIEKRPSMVRNLRVMLARANLTDQEVRTFRGVITALSKGRGRVLAKLAAKSEDKGSPGG